MCSEFLVIPSDSSENTRPKRNPIAHDGGDVFRSLFLRLCPASHCSPRCLSVLNSDIFLQAQQSFCCCCCCCCPREQSLQAHMLDTFVPFCRDGFYPCSLLFVNKPHLLSTCPKLSLQVCRFTACDPHPITHLYHHSLHILLYS